MSHVELSRRDFLRLGAAGSAVLATTGFIAACARTEPAPAQGYRYLRDAEVELFRALIPAVVAGALPASAGEREPLIAETLRRVDLACYRLGTPARAQLHQLFDLLGMRLTRVLTTGVFAPWREASVDDATAFLRRWRESRVGLFNGGHRAIVGLVAASYYGLPAAWPLSGYPGPLAFAYQAVNR